MPTLTTIETGRPPKKMEGDWPDYPDMFEALLARGVRIELAGEVDPMRSNFTNSLKRMPVEMRLAG